MLDSTTSVGKVHGGLTVSQIHKSFGATHILNDVNLSVGPGQFVCLLGPSGCGKTTLLRCLAGLEQPGEGTITINHLPVFDARSRLLVPAERRGLGMVFQHYALWPHMSVEDNIAYPLKKRGHDREVQQTKVYDLARLIGIDHLLGRMPAQLSGGQQQRVALARALAAEPALLLLDEPLSNLDASLRIQLRRELRNIHDRMGMTTIMVTHDQEEAFALADVVAVMHEGRVVQFGTPDQIMDRPGTRYVAGFIGYDNFLSGQVSAVRDGNAVITLPTGSVTIATEGDVTLGGTVAVACRSDQLALVPIEVINGLPVGQALRITRLGRSEEIEFRVGDDTVVVRRIAGSGAPIAVGDSAGLNVPSHSPLVS